MAYDSVYRDTLTVYSQSIPTVAPQTSVTNMNVNFPKMFNASDTLRLAGKWRQGKIISGNWGSYCGTVNASSCWTTADHCYIGVRYKNLLGWIKVSIKKYQHGIIVYEFACCK